MNKQSKVVFPLALLSLGAALSGTATAGTSYDTSLATPGGTSGATAVYYGSGNAGTNNSWTVTTGSGVELGLQGLDRFVGPIPSSLGTYVTNAGEAGGLTPWDFAYSIDLQPVGSQSSLLLDQITSSITITDLNSPGSQITFSGVGNGTLVLPGAGPVDDAEVSSTNFSSDISKHALSGDPFGAQNAENIGFFNPGNPLYPFLTGSPFNLDIPDTYTITLAVNGPDGLSLSDSINVETVAPEPSTWGLLGTGVLVVAFSIRRRRTAASQSR